MLRKCKQYIVLLGIATLVLLLSACGTPTLAGSVSPIQTLQNSAKAMSQLKSAHFDVQATLHVQSTGANSGVSFNITGHGDAVAPDQADVNLSLGQNPLLSLVSTSGKIYVQAGDGTWYVTDRGQVTNSTEKIFTENLPSDMGKILSDLQDAKLTDKGPAVLNGETLDHISITLDAQTLQALSTQLNGLLPTSTQSSANALNQATVDLWIDTTTWYVHQATLNIAMHIDLSKMPGLNLNGQNLSLPATVLPVTLNAQLDISKFNQPVNIQAPSGAVALPQK
jgi:LppX_LprAFG lipoprotein